jgi:hypothetical protein
MVLANSMHDGTVGGGLPIRELWYKMALTVLLHSPGHPAVAQPWLSCCGYPWLSCYCTALVVLLLHSPDHPAVAQPWLSCCGYPWLSCCCTALVILLWSSLVILLWLSLVILLLHSPGYPVVVIPGYQAVAQPWLSCCSKAKMSQCVPRLESCSWTIKLCVTLVGVFEGKMS